MSLDAKLENGVVGGVALDDLQRQCIDLILLLLRDVCDEFGEAIDFERFPHSEVYGLRQSICQLCTKKRNENHDGCLLTNAMTHSRTPYVPQRTTQDGECCLRRRMFLEY